MCFKHSNRLLLHLQVTTNVEAQYSGDTDITTVQLSLPCSRDTVTDGSIQR